ncbi:hypothetical protein CDL12_10050 [Handroanthus impetiginosus]|uniref:Uncharacterized protein n=1 Tax=Handroanthus impetiginosus TaxID=429701 RepID=A0A2G9HIB2_9LAMI|nr:hypothetical protein CDL12_10050 [Handroanthus impetiginosus]
MSNLTKLEFEALDITCKNYLSWVLDAEIHLDAKGLGAAIIAENEISNQDKAKTMIFLRHHLHEGLKAEYLTVKDPLELWNNLRERYDHQKTVILPKARYDWMHLRLQDFKTVSDYNSAIFKISSQLKLCGEKITDEDLLEKIFSTFHTSNVLLQQQYPEQNNELLMKNYEARPTGSAPFPEVNAAVFNKSGGGQNRGHNNTRGRGRGRGCDRGRNNYRYRSGNNYNSHHQKWINNDEKEKDKSGQSNPSKDKENICYRCDDDFKGLTDITHLDVADFFESHE